MKFTGSIFFNLFFTDLLNLDILLRFRYEFMRAFVSAIYKRMNAPAFHRKFSNSILIRSPNCFMTTSKLQSSGSTFLNSNYPGIASDLSTDRLTRRDWLIALVVALVAGGVRVALSQHRGFWLDEYYTLRAAQMSWGEMAHDRLSAGHSPIYFFYARWPLIFGTTEWILRLSSALLVIASVLLTTGLAGALGLRRYLPAVWVMGAILPYWITAGTEYRYMMPVITLTAAIAWGGAVYCRRWSGRAGLLVAALLALVLWVHGSAQFVALGMLIYLLWEGRARAGRWTLAVFLRVWPAVVGFLGSVPLIFLVTGGKKSPAKLPSFGSFVKDTCEVVFGKEDIWSSVLVFPEVLILISEAIVLVLAVWIARRELRGGGKGGGHGVFWRLCSWELFSVSL